MRAWVACTALAATLCSPQAAQAATEAESHILSAFTSRADPRVLAADVKLGPALRDQLGGETDSRKIYGALTQRIAGKPLRVTFVPPAEAARYALLVDGNFSDPLVLLEAGEVALLMQYAAKEKHVAFVEQVRGPAPHAEPAPPAPPPPQVELPPQAPKPAPVVEIPLPAAPPPVVEKPKPAPAPMVVEKPKPPAAPPVAAPKPPSPAPAAAVSRRPALKPRGECVIKPVMSDEDLWNCSAPARPAALEALPPPVSASKPSPAAVERPQRVECVIKPVMSEDDLRACGAR
jgi:hypothetical protein